jgi:hypothetical protein
MEGAQRNGYPASVGKLVREGDCRAERKFELLKIADAMVAAASLDRVGGAKITMRAHWPRVTSSQLPSSTIFCHSIASSKTYDCNQ